VIFLIGNWRPQTEKNGLSLKEFLICTFSMERKTAAGVKRKFTIGKKAKYGL